MFIRWCLAEFTNWRDEQRAWRETCVLFDQSHHMVDQYVEGPDALKLLSHLAINSFAKFPVNRAKQFVPCSYDGHVIGDGILFHLAENKLVFVGRAPIAQAGFNSTPRPAATTSPPKKTTGRLPAPVASRWFATLSLPDSRSERQAGDRETERRPDPGHQILQHGLHHHRGTQGSRAASRHGGRSRLEVWGPYAEGEEIRAAIVEAGKDFGLRQVGSAGLRHQYAGIGLDSVAAARCLHGRQNEGLPGMASRRRAMKAPALSAAVSIRTTSKTTI